MKKLIVAAFAAASLASFAQDVPAQDVGQGEDIAVQPVPADETIPPDEPDPEPEPSVLDAFVCGTGPAEYTAGKDVTYVRGFAFAENRIITTVRLDSMTSCGKAIFQGCLSLRNVSLASVTNTACLTGAFSGCPSLRSVAIPAVEFAKGLPGFPWNATSNDAVFRFANGNYDRFGRRID